MFEGLNINRGEWKALADVHEAKMKAIEDEKKRLEGGDEQGKHISLNACLMYILSAVSLTFSSFLLQLKRENQRHVWSARLHGLLEDLWVAVWMCVCVVCGNA